MQVVPITYWKWMSTEAKKRGSWNSRPSGTKITQIFQAYDNAATYLMWKIITQPFAQLLGSVSKWPFFISIRLNVAVQWREELVGRTTVWKCWSSIPGSSWLTQLQRSLLLFESHYAWTPLALTTVHLTASACLAQTTGPKILDVEEVLKKAPKH